MRIRLIGLCLVAAMTSDGWARAGHAAVADVAIEVLVRDCIARFGSGLAKACEDTLSDEAVNFVPPRSRPA
jgi:hypothetical protein